MSIVNYLKFNVLSTPDPANPGNTIVQVQTGPHGLFSGGLVMDVVVGVDTVTAHSLQAANIPIPSPISLKALFDTGCTVTSIDKTIVSSLGLKVRGYTPICTANGTTTASKHVVSLNFPGTNLAGKLAHAVQAVNLAGQQFHMLIGRDLMASWSITYNGPSGFVSIAD